MSYAKWILMIWLMSLLAGCNSTTGGSPGSGFKLMTPKRATAIYIAKNDRVFAEEVASNNRTCRRSKGCQK